MVVVVGELRNGKCDHGGSVDAPLASFCDGDSQPRSLGAARAGSLNNHSSSNVFTPHRGGAPGAAASVAIDGGGASGATCGLRDDACGHGGSAGAPLAPRGDGDCQRLSLGAARASSLDVHSSSIVFTPHLGGAPGVAVSVARNSSGASSATRGLCDGACGHGGSVGASLAPRSYGDSQPRSISAVCAGSLNVHTSSSVFTPHRGSAPGAAVSVASDGGGASGGTRGLRNDVCGHGESVGASLAPRDDSDSQPFSLGATRAGSLDVHSPRNVFTPHRGGAPVASVSVARDGSGACGATRELRKDTCGHGGSVGAPLASFCDSDSQPRSLGAAFAGSLDNHSSSNVLTPHRGGAPGAKVSVARGTHGGCGCNCGCANTGHPRCGC